MCTGSKLGFKGPTELAIRSVNPSISGGSFQPYSQSKDLLNGNLLPKNVQYLGMKTNCFPRFRKRKLLQTNYLCSYFEQPNELWHHLVVGLIVIPLISPLDSNKPLFLLINHIFLGLSIGRPLRHFLRAAGMTPCL